LTETYCYSSRSVLEIELAGNQLIGSLLGEFIPAALQLPGQVRGKHAQKLLQLISPLPKEADAYTRVLRVTDYVASMTDSYAVSLYRRLKGIALPGAR
jgi:dGTPase